MKPKPTSYFLLGLLLFSINSNGFQTPKKQPNIIYILADDLGFGEIGVQGQQYIKTPNIDALASTGMRFTNHYAGAPVCAPSRCVLLTGQHMGHAEIRGNDGMKSRGDVWNYEKVSASPELEGQRPMRAGTRTLAHLLQAEGYKTGIFGKWGLGGPTTQSTPNHMGFDEFFGYNCQRQAHNLYPAHLWHNDKKIKLENTIYNHNTKLKAGADPNASESYALFTQKDYAPKKIHEAAINFIETNKAEPFFLYYASPLPHLPLQVPNNEIEAYTSEFKNETPYLGNKGYLPCRYPKATYAAMISYLDKQIGDLIKTLKAQGIYENTIIMFSSDNGPTYTGGVNYTFFESSKPFKNGHKYTKGSLNEGGIRTPFIVSWPGYIKAGTTSDHPSVFYDVLPTLCDITGIKTSIKTDGISFKNTLLGQPQAKHDFLYWEFHGQGGQQAIRIGPWKGLIKNMHKGNTELQLYHLVKDTLESNNLASKHPEIVNKMQMIMKREHKTSPYTYFQIKVLED